MYFDRFDIVAAYYWFCANYHNGQLGALYARLSRIIDVLKFIPAPNWNGPEDVSENCKAIYDNLVDNRKK